MELSEIKGIGVKTLEHLKEEGILSADDLLLTLPKTYTIYEIQEENLFTGEAVCVPGIVDSKPVFLKYRRNVNTIIFYAILRNFRIKCVVFSSDYLRYKLFKGIPVVLYGRYKKENKEFLVQNIFFEQFQTKIEIDYRLKNISNALMSKAVGNALSAGCTIEDTLPLELKNKYRLYPMTEFLRASHFPASKQDYIQIQRRRKYEEFFWYSVSLELLRQTRKQGVKLKREIHMEIIDGFIRQLPYELTEDQVKVIGEIREDILSDFPMNRLVQGDVGCGKSIIAYISALMLVSAGYQAVLMVPTELLAVQQFENIKRLFSPLNLTIELLTSSVKSKDREDILYRLMNHRVHIIVGTHALLEENVRFHKLGIAIIDEQHRFGVDQRGRLISKFPGVDCLYLTATPIPRTLGLTSFGDLDISSVHTLPANRKAIQTFVYDYSRLDEIASILMTHIRAGEQAYIVVPLVEENEEINAMDISAAKKYFTEALPEVNLGVVHGKLKAVTKNRIMQEFQSGRLQVLISTTVIEVGVDVKNATVMVILDANRYGLAQIHQLRGRVGRGDKASFCYLVSRVESPRLEIIKNTLDGFEIAVEDFKLRGPGDYLGKEQSGFVGLTYADFETDFKIWSCAKADGIEYCHKFMENHSKNRKFLEILAVNKTQKGKIN